MKRLVLALMGLVLVLTGCTQPDTPATPPAPVQGFLSAPQAATALSVAQRLATGAPSGPKYDRDLQFGADWIDKDRNCRDTRQEILVRDFLVVSASRCQVINGTFDDPYTGKRIQFTAGRKTSSAVQIDHVVPLKAAWTGGAWRWTQQQRVDYANDPYVVHASDGPSNGAKGARLMDAWQPPNRAYWCVYSARMVGILDHFKIKPTPAAKDKLVEVLRGCPNERIPRYPR